MNISLPRQIDHFVTQQVRSGRFRTKNEVVCAALGQMEESEQQRELDAYKAAFENIDRFSPTGEPTEEDLAEINRVVQSVRTGRRQRKAA